MVGGRVVGGRVVGGCVVGRGNRGIKRKDVKRFLRGFLLQFVVGKVEKRIVGCSVEGCSVEGFSFVIGVFVTSQPSVSSPEQHFESKYSVIKDIIYNCPTLLAIMSIII